MTADIYTIVLGSIILLMGILIAFNWKLYTCRKECIAYLALLERYQKECGHRQEIARKAKNSPSPNDSITDCETSLAFAKSYRANLGMTLDSTKEPAVFGIPNWELAGLISGSSNGEAFLVLGKRSVGNYLQNCIILFPRDGLNPWRLPSYPAQTNETFPLRFTVAEVDYDDVFRCGESSGSGK